MKLNLSKNQYTDLIPSEKKSLLSNLKEIYEIISDNSRNYIFFDLETLGMHPNAETDQIIEIAASVCSGFNSTDTIGSFHTKIKISNASKMIFDDGVMRDIWIRRNSKSNSDMTPEKILSMTDYYNNLDNAKDENEAVADFLHFISKFDNPVLVAHNSGYDVKFLSSRAGRNDLKLENCDVIDTLKICRHFFIPLLLSRKNYTIEKTIYEKLVNRNSKKIQLSSKLGNVADAVGVNSTCWHTANGDVEMLRGVMYYICEFFKSNIDVDIRKYQSQNTMNKATRKKAK